MPVPQHVAIIMDGNGRWAQRRNHPRIFGHIRGSQRVRPIVTECGRLGIKYLTLFAFSSENWGRPNDEVNVLMRLLQKYLHKERSTLMKNNVRLRAIGQLNKLPERVLESLNETIELTKNNSGVNLIFALSYGSRKEILDAVKQIAADAVNKKILPSQIDESVIENHLYTSEIPDPDLVIRTSGEKRISNFLLWQSAYSEFFVSEKLWPDFDEKELKKALDEFAGRQRRFGLTAEQISQYSMVRPSL